MNKQRFGLLSLPVHRELNAQGIYLDFEENIVLPELVDETPVKRLHIKKLGDKILISGSLVFSQEGNSSVLRFASPLFFQYTSPFLKMKAACFI